jgi:hypothetical protein
VPVDDLPASALGSQLQCIPADQARTSPILTACLDVPVKRCRYANAPLPDDQIRGGVPVIVALLGFFTGTGMGVCGGLIVPVLIAAI